jgi:hypothetical protein
MNFISITFMVEAMLGLLRPLEEYLGHCTSTVSALYLVVIWVHVKIFFGIRLFYIRGT